MTVVVAALAWTTGTEGAPGLDAAVGWAPVAAVAGTSATGGADACGAALGDVTEGAGVGFIFE
jgi:hypothetical protein